MPETQLKVLVTANVAGLQAGLNQAQGAVAKTSDALVGLQGVSADAAAGLAALKTNAATMASSLLSSGVSVDELSTSLRSLGFSAGDTASVMDAVTGAAEAQEVQMAGTAASVDRMTGAMAYGSVRAGAFLAKAGPMGYVLGSVARQSKIMAPLFKGMFPLIGIALAGQMLGQLLESLQKDKDKIFQVREQMDQLTSSTISAVSAFRMENLRLEDQIDALEHIPSPNGITIAAMQAEEQVDKLNRSLAQTITKEMNLFQSGGVLGAIFGSHKTTIHNELQPHGLAIQDLLLKMQMLRAKGEQNTAEYRKMTEQLRAQYLEVEKIANKWATIKSTLSISINPVTGGIIRRGHANDISEATRINAERVAVSAQEAIRALDEESVRPQLLQHVAQLQAQKASSGGSSHVPTRGKFIASGTDSTYTTWEKEHKDKLVKITDAISQTQHKHATAMDSYHNSLGTISYGADIQLQKQLQSKIKLHEMYYNQEGVLRQTYFDKKWNAEEREMQRDQRQAQQKQRMMEDSARKQATTLSNALMEGLSNRPYAWQDAFAKLWNHALGSSLQSALQTTIMEIMQRSVATTAAMTASGAATQTAADKQQQGSAASLAAAKTYAVIAGIPVVGPFIAPPLAAAAYAAVMAFDKGGIVPETSLAMVHKNEMVLPSHISQFVKSSAEKNAPGSAIPGGAGGVHLHYSPSISAIDTGGVKDMLDAHKDLFAASMMRYLRGKNVA